MTCAHCDRPSALAISVPVNDIPENEKLRNTQGDDSRTVIVGFCNVHRWMVREILPDGITLRG